ncbi:hypothetical protein [Natrinema salsiterrestre]|uniref:Uncharacterized protein n=1 Tax=Natrinema salsiterrestre TaxID=2950540 RepID=A0A9Q4Q5A7_9EURY|nr:hypothetical protein [Natrinema salsiterrestre]MDF9748382.1 hypothetical protein [Natrinema salsiterrestre]
MIDTQLVDTIGAFAGVIWMSAALYFQFWRRDHVHPALVSSLFLIGVALLMASSALVLAGRPAMVVLLGLIANGLFAALGIAVWYGLDQNTPTCEVAA